MHPEIEKAIEQLEDKIARLESARDTLIDTFCPPDSPRRRKMAERQASQSPVGMPAEESEPMFTGGVRLRRRRGRKDIVAEFIRQHGPSTRPRFFRERVFHREAWHSC